MYDIYYTSNASLILTTPTHTQQVTPKNFYRLLQTGQAGLLFPGGVREVFHGKGEDYKLFWHESTDFVRTAARFNTTIIPISAVGAADSANILLDADELLDLPFGLGDRKVRVSIVYLVNSCVQYEVFEI